VFIGLDVWGSRNLLAHGVFWNSEMIKRDNSCALSKVEGLPSSSIRILIADDFADWRRQVRLLLKVRTEWQVIAEASDGREAIQRTEELKPDLVLLDIGLPKLNGIEAARRIRELSPRSKIIFLSLYDSLDEVQAALSTGAMGYVLKTDSLRELVPAVYAVLQGKQFVSSSLNLKGFEFTDRLSRRPGAAFSE
jgi:DNA-binding NarL/FixJ family response regulator